MRITLCFIIFINLCISLFGQVHFTRLNNEDGLSHSEVKAILQDSYGYMWIGTRNKLNRYDGSEFKVLDCYDPVANRRNNNIAALCEDVNRLLWIGTDDGVFVYDPALETFTYLERWLNPDQSADFLYNWVSNIVGFFTFPWYTESEYTDKSLSTLFDIGGYGIWEGRAIVTDGR